MMPIIINLINLPQNLVRANNNWLLRAIITVLNLKNNMNPNPLIIYCLQSQKHNTWSFLFRLGNWNIIIIWFNNLVHLFLMFVYWKAYLIYALIELLSNYPNGQNHTMKVLVCCSYYSPDEILHWISKRET